MARKRISVFSTSLTKMVLLSLKPTKLETGFFFLTLGPWPPLLLRAFTLEVFCAVNSFIPLKCKSSPSLLKFYNSEMSFYDPEANTWNVIKQISTESLPFTKEDKENKDSFRVTSTIPSSPSVLFFISSSIKNPPTLCFREIEFTALPYVIVFTLLQCLSHIFLVHFICPMQFFRHINLLQLSFVSFTTFYNFSLSPASSFYQERELNK